MSRLVDIRVTKNQKFANVDVLDFRDKECIFEMNIQRELWEHWERTDMVKAFIQNITLAKGYRVNSVYNQMDNTVLYQN